MFELHCLPTNRNLPQYFLCREVTDRLFYLLPLNMAITVIHSQLKAIVDSYKQSIKF
jgi:hypothetical protein